ncbi:AsmA-like C-terminal region-containing protein [Roseibacillus persicicus]|nr:AsmA-like C-terminal region-containing protein [Roseibacillus persicicus]
MRCPWFRHCQSCFVGMVLLTLVVGGTILWKVNQRGFSGEWGERLQEQLDAYGLHAEFSSVRLSFSRGLVAKDLSIFADEDRTTLLASADLLYLDIDRAIALRGQWQVRSAEFENAYLRLPDSCAPHHLSQLTGKASLSRENGFAITETTGRLGQLDISLDANLLDFQLPGVSDGGEEDSLPLDDFLAMLHQEIEHWKTSETLPAHLALKVEGSLAKPSTLDGSFRFTAPVISRLNYEMRDLNLAGRINRSSLLLEEANFNDGSGSFAGNGFYNFLKRQANFEVASSASLKRLMRTGLGIDKLSQLEFTQPPSISARGELLLPPDSSPELSLTGEINLKKFRFLDGAWESLTSDFSLQKNNLYLRDLVLQHPEGSLTGQLLFQNENVRYQAHSTLPPHLFDPFIEPDGDIRKTLDRVKFGDDSEVVLDLAGSIRPSNLTDWSASGQIRLKNFSYNGVPANYASSSFNLTPLQAIYTRPEIEFDLTSDRSYRAYGGPEQAVVRADSVSYDDTEKLTRIEHLHGVCWVPPVLRLFIPSVADYLERTYRTSAPPAFSSSGVIDHRPERSRTSFHTHIQAPAPLYYTFLGKAVELRETSAKIHTHHRQVDVSELSSYAFSGPINGQLTVLLPSIPGRSPDFRGELRWTRLRLSDIGETYGFEKIESGLLTGRMDFLGTAGKIETLNGSGNFGLEQGELFKAPVFGPLSPLIAGIQGHDRASHETARDASANFLIRSGILLTDDFITSTDSLTVKAEGSIDLARKTLDMTARADTEGLLKLVTLPLNLTGFSGLFQFRGTGSVADPKWENTPFTRPQQTNKPPLFADPPKGRVVPE